MKNAVKQQRVCNHTISLADGLKGDGIIPMNRIELLIARKKIGVTQRQLALAVGVNENQICKIETGRAKPNRQLADKIARRLESSAKEIFGDM